jgi:hypothetical protein
LIIKTPRKKSFGRKKLFKRSHGCCFYCGNLVTASDCQHDRDWLILQPSVMVIEHKTPLIRGGADDWDNAACACHKCNGTKGSLTADEFRLLMAFRHRDLDYRFYGEEPKASRRDWLLCHSSDHEETLVIHNMPSAAEGYLMRRNAHARSEAWRPIGARG